MSGLVTGLVLKHSKAKLSVRLVLIAIADHCDPDGYAFPRPKLIASEAGVSRETVRTAVEKLLDMGELAVVVEGHRQRPPLYRVLIQGNGECQDIGHYIPVDYARILGIEGQRIGPSKGRGLGLHREPPVGTAKEPLPERPFGPPAGAPKERPRDPIWDALTDLFGEPQTKTEKSLRGKTVRELREVNATPAGIKARAAEWPRLYPKIDLTQTALTKHWTKLGDEAGYVEPDADDAERAERNRLAVAEQQRMLDEHWRRTKETDGSQAHN